MTESADEPPDAAADTLEERYDLDDFGPREMQQMSAEEWEALFDADSWITGTALLDRVESDVRARIEGRDIFAVLEREGDGDSERLVAYSDEGYAIVWGDGTVEGRGTVLRDVEPVVALCSMEDYEPATPEGEGTLPSPDSVEQGGSELGNTVMQAVGVVQVLAGVGLLIGWLVFGLAVYVPIVAVAFILFGVFVLILVANARLSDRFRAEEYRERLAAAQVGSDTRPAFVPEDTAQPAVEASEARDGEREE
jgi:hypothetical protein